MPRLGGPRPGGSMAARPRKPATASKSAGWAAIGEEPRAHRKPKRDLHGGRFRRNRQDAGAFRYARAGQVLQGRGAARLPGHAVDSPVRGKSRAALWYGLHRRLLPSLHRPGGGRRRHADGVEGGRRGRHRLSRPRAYAGDRYGSARRDGRADGPPLGLLQGQGRLDAHVLQGEEVLRRTRHRRERRCRSARGWPSPIATRRTTRSP